MARKRRHPLGSWQERVESWNPGRPAVEGRRAMSRPLANLLRLTALVALVWLGCWVAGCNSWRQALAGPAGAAVW